MLSLKFLSITVVLLLLKALIQLQTMQRTGAEWTLPKNRLAFDELTFLYAFNKDIAHKRVEDKIGTSWYLSLGSLPNAPESSEFDVC
jgi:hypothetical protein